jgi:Outer membrane protein beta-barrel domain
MRFSLLCAGLLLAAGSVQAQVYLSAGPTLGYSHTSIDNAAGGTYSYGPSFEQNGLWRPQGGLTLNARLGHFALQPSVLLLQKGSESTYTMQSQAPNGQRYTRRTEENIKVNYLEIPLNLVASLGRQGNGLQLVAGPYMALTLKGRGLSRSYPVGPTPPPYGEVDPGATYEHQREYTVGEPKDYNYGYGVLRRVDWGGNAGLGYARGHWQLQATYSMSLRKEEPLVQTPRFSYIYTYLPHRTWQLRLSYLIGGQRERKLPGFLNFLNLKPAQ